MGPGLIRPAAAPAAAAVPAAAAQAPAQTRTTRAHSTPAVAEGGMGAVAAA